MKFITRLAPIALLFTGACSDVEDHDHNHVHGHNHGLITTLILNFTPSGGGETLSFQWSDPENDGDPIVDDILLPDASSHDHHDAQEYALDIEVWNDLEDPAEDVTPEVAAEDRTHQFFFTGSAVEGPATGDNPNAILRHAYADTDADGLPLGMENTFTTLAWGSGELVVTLRHLPLENDAPTKVEGLAETVASDGFAAIGGDNGVQITFDVEVQ